MAANTERTTMGPVDAGSVAVHGHHEAGTWSKAKRFVWHLLQMVVAMEAGMGAYHVLRATALAGTSFAAFTTEHAMLGYWVMEVAMTIPMVALMRYFHKSTWRYCLGMTAAMAVPAVVLTILAQAGLLAQAVVNGGISDLLMVLAMAGYMLIWPTKHEHGAHERTAAACH